MTDTAITLADLTRIGAFKGLVPKGNPTLGGIRITFDASTLTVEATDGRALARWTRSLSYTGDRWARTLDASDLRAAQGAFRARSEDANPDDTIINVVLEDDGLLLELGPPRQATFVSDGDEPAASYYVRSATEEAKPWPDTDALVTDANTTPADPWDATEPIRVDHTSLAAVAATAPGALIRLHRGPSHLLCDATDADGSWTGIVGTTQPTSDDDDDDE